MSMMLEVGLGYSTESSLLSRCRSSMFGLRDGEIKLKRRKGRISPRSLWNGSIVAPGFGCEEPFDPAWSSSGAMSRDSRLGRVSRRRVTPDYASSELPHV